MQDISQTEETPVDVHPPAADIIRRMSRGEGWEDVVAALRKAGATYENQHVRRFVLRLPMRGVLR